MSCGGVVQAMITSLKNNSRRGHRTNYFEKGHHKTSGKSTGIPVIKISEEKRKAMRDQLIAENKRDEQKVMVIFTVLLVIMIFLFFKLVFLCLLYYMWRAHFCVTYYMLSLIQESGTTKA